MLPTNFAKAATGMVEKALDLFQCRGGEGDKTYAFICFAVVLGKHALVDCVLHILHRRAPADVGHEVVEVGLGLGGFVAHKPHLREQIAVVQIAETGISKGFGPETVDRKYRLGCLDAVGVEFAHGYVRIP